MSDKLKLDFDIYYKELENFTGHFKTSSQQIETDKLLSRAGKSEQVEKLKAEHLKNVDGLSKRFNAEFDKRVSSIEKYNKGEKNDAVLNSIKKKFLKNESLTSDETNRLLLSEMRENKTIMKKSNFQQMLSGADIEQVRKTSQTLADNGDSEKLEWLQEMVSLRGDTVLSNTVQAQVDAVRDSQLSDEQRNLQMVSQRIQKETKLFQYSVERSKKGDFVDVRNNDNTEVQ